METGLASLFVGSLLASTIVPGGVEVLIYYLYQTGSYSFLSLLLVATAGNTIGGIITFFMGMLLRKGLTGLKWQQRIDRFFRLDDKAMGRVQRWGIPALFLSWMPIIGDPIVLAGGYLRLPKLASCLMILFSKFSRYLVLLWLIPAP